MLNLFINQDLEQNVINYEIISMTIEFFIIRPFNLVFHFIH